MKKGLKYPAEILTQSEIRSMLDACTSGSIGLRNKAILYCGLRISELVALRPCDVTDETVRVLHGKNDKARTVGVDPEAAAVVAQWMERRRSIGLTGRAPLFCTLRGEPLHTNAVRELLKRLADKAGIVKRIHPHQFRHTFAAHAARQLPVHYVQEALGHTSLDVTARYINHLGGAAVEAVRGLTW
jgi:integrase/recombinase XerD